MQRTMLQAGVPVPTPKICPARLLFSRKGGGGENAARVTCVFLVKKSRIFGRRRCNSPFDFSAEIYAPRETETVTASFHRRQRRARSSKNGDTVARDRFQDFSATEIRAVGKFETSNEIWINLRKTRKTSVFGKYREFANFPRTGFFFLFFSFFRRLENVREEP